MALEFEKITSKIRLMGETTRQRSESANLELVRLLRQMEHYGDNWSHIELCLAQAKDKADKQKYRSAEPFTKTEPLHLGIDPPDATPEQATLIAIDGSQALPSRHAPHLYYLINTGTIIYSHGDNNAPIEISQPELFYLGDDVTESLVDFQSGQVSRKRDMAEIGGLARCVWENKYARAPIIAILDQRLQYFPIGVNNASEANQFVRQWIEGMETIKQCNALLVGYIERPETSAVITLLNTLDWGKDGHDVAALVERPELADTALFTRVLEPGQRSCLFEVVNQSTNYLPFVEANQEICFFYFKPPGLGDVTRVDVPKWAAQQEDVIEVIHALLFAQCRLLGGYPYVLARADEVAVVQHSDREYLEHLIDLEMLQQGISSQATVKKLSKDWSRGGKRSHSI